MNLPFTQQQFFDVFERYNLAIWPIQIIAYGLGLVVVALLIWRLTLTDRAISAILALFWIWMGAAYHLAFFSEINPAAVAFGALFVLQGALFAFAGVVRPGLVFRARWGALAAVGVVMIAYALVGYPLLGLAFGHEFPRAPMFGVVPCPTTIFTFGLLLWTTGRVPKYLLAIPLLWALVGVSAALTLGVAQDYGLGVAGLLGTALVVWRDSREAPEARLRELHV